MPSMSELVELAKERLEELNEERARLDEEASALENLIAVHGGSTSSRGLKRRGRPRKTVEAAPKVSKRGRKAKPKAEKGGKRGTRRGAVIDTIREFIAGTKGQFATADVVGHVSESGVTKMDAKSLPSAVSTSLRKLVEAGEVKQIGRGRYKR